MNNIKQKKCKNCKGIGFIPLGEGIKGIKECPFCKGTGKVEKKILPTKPAITPLRKSKTRVNTAGTTPTERKTFVKPALPEPMSRMSFFELIFVKITAKLMLPKR